MTARILVVCATLVASPGCRGEPDEVRVPVLTAAQLEALEPSARTEFETAQEAAQRSTRDPDLHGRLAMLLHAHGFLDAAASSYRNALRLAPQEARWHRLDAHRAAEAGREDEALERASRAVELDAGSVAARITLGQLELRRERFEEARKHFQAALEKEPTSFASLRGMGTLEFRAGNLAEAVNFMEQALVVEPRDPGVHYTAALAFERLGETGRAEEHLAASRRGPTRRPAIEPPTEIVTLRGQGARAALAAGTDLLQQGLYKEAVRAFEEAATAEPGSADTQNALGAALEQTGDLELARGRYERAVALEPDLAVARRNLGVLLGRLGRFDEALEQLEAAVRLDPGQAEPHFALGVALEAQGRTDQAVVAFRGAVSRDPGMTGAHLRLGILLGGGERLEDALSHLRTATELEPDSGEAHHYLSVALHRLGNTAEAMEHERRAIALAEAAGDADLLGTAHYTLALLLQETGGLAEALSYLERALARYPENIEILSEVARTHHLAGNHANAIEVQGRVIRARPVDADAHYRLGVFQAASGDRAAARRAFEDSLRVLPGFAPAAAAIDRLNRQR